MKIAIIGSGISGMVSAYLLCKDHDITVFEANDYFGGHTNTISVTNGDDAFEIDTGFIVFNDATYPNFVKLLRQLGVAWQPSQMGFSVKCERTGIEYSSRSLNALFAQRRNLVNPAFYKMLQEIYRFRSASGELLRCKDYTLTLGHYLEVEKYSEDFVQRFLLPLGAAIWSADPNRFREFPARYFAEFFRNHRFLDVIGQPKWLVIQGGSKRYAEKLVMPYQKQIRINCRVESVARHTDFVTVKPVGFPAEKFDEVIFATHSDQALAILTDASESEQEILGSIPYQENLTILHSDTSLLPIKKLAWSSWNFVIPQEELHCVAITYYMNVLQNLKSSMDFCVTLNLSKVIVPHKILKKIVYHHPVYNPQALAGQKRWKEISGINRTHYCGAYWGYGFHEDGVNSALAVCNYFGKTL